METTWSVVQVAYSILLSPFTLITFSQHPIQPQPPQPSSQAPSSNQSFIKISARSDSLSSPYSTNENIETCHIDIIPVDSDDDDDDDDLYASPPSCFWYTSIVDDILLLDCRL